MRKPATDHTVHANQAFAADPDFVDVPVDELLDNPYLDASSAWAFRKKWHRVSLLPLNPFGQSAPITSPSLVWWMTS